MFRHTTFSPARLAKVLNRGEGLPPVSCTKLCLKKQNHQHQLMQASQYITNISIGINRPQSKLIDTVAVFGSYHMEMASALQLYTPAPSAKEPASKWPHSSPAKATR